MSGSLLDIKKQIKGIKNTRKITKAMQLVAASKMKNFQKKALSVRGFTFDLLYVLNKNKRSFDYNRFLDQRDSGKTIFVLYSSDKGLCGALNQRLFKTLLGSNIWKNTPKSERELIVIGKKAAAFAKFHKLNVVDEIKDIKEDMTNFDAVGYVGEILKHWDTKDVKKIYMVAPHYRNSFTFYPIMKQFLPLSDDMLNAHVGVHPEVFTKKMYENTSSYMEHEYYKESVSSNLIRLIVKSTFIQGFFELKSSEYSSRMLAMHNATEAADKIMESKTLILNKARQAAITQEIAEIIAASM
jgi:F-type H+-transporting ATPase subunit gamma